MPTYRLTVEFDADDADEAHEQMDEAMQAFHSIIKERREDEDGRNA